MKTETATPVSRWGKAGSLAGCKRVSGNEMVADLEDQGMWALTSQEKGR